MERKLAGEILSRFERKGLTIKDAKIITINPDLAKRHYAEHVEKGFYPDLESFIGRSPCLAVILEGPEEIVSIVRGMMGATNPLEAEMGTIRGDYGTQLTENLIHGSDSDESAEREMNLFFA